ncbi:MAG: hypothetical protein E7376_01650 [Clostridiales bacterium]|nr:hypothetical protein [Clostridiales bacterium]
MANLFNDFDDNNLFDDSFDFLQQSGDSLFGSTTSKKEEKPTNQDAKPEQNVNANSDLETFSTEDSLPEQPTNEKAPAKDKKVKEKKVKEEKPKKEKKKKNKEEVLNTEENQNTQELSEENTPSEEASENVLEQETAEDVLASNENTEELVTNEEKPKKRGRKKKTEQAQEQNDQSEENVVNSLSEDEEEQVDLVEQPQEEMNSDQEQEQSEEKPKKEKKVKQPKEKKECKLKSWLKKANKKILIPVVCGVAAVLIAIIVALVVHNIKINTKLLTPNFEIFERSYGTTLVIDKIENVQKYEVVVIHGQTQTVFTSTSNIVEMANYFSQPGEFTIKVRALGATQKAHSDYSEEKQIVNYIKLDTPVVFCQDEVLTWNVIENAAYYKVYYMVNSDTDSVEYIELAQGEGLMSFDLTTLNVYGPGEYNITIEAVATEGTYYVNSNFTNTYTYEYYDTLQTPNNANFNSQTNLLTFEVFSYFYVPEKFKVVVTLNDGNYSLSEHVLYTSELIQEQLSEGMLSRLKLTADFTDFFEAEVLSMTIAAVSVNQYQTGSSAVTVQLS